MKKAGKKTASLTTEKDLLIKEQAERIAELKKINADLTFALEEYRLKEKQIVETLDFARRKSSEIISESKVKYALECERLALFRNKWISAVNEGRIAADYARTEKILEECRAEMERAFDDDAEISDYLAERDRLGDGPKLDYRAIIDKENSPAAPARIANSSEEILSACNEQKPAPPERTAPLSPSKKTSVRNVDELSDEELEELLRQL